jgi:hypothetical protein
MLDGGGVANVAGDCQRRRTYRLDFRGRRVECPSIEVEEHDGRALAR